MRAPCRPWISPLAHRSITVEVYSLALQLLIIHRLLTLRLCALQVQLEFTESQQAVHYTTYIQAFYRKNFTLAVCNLLIPSQLQIQLLIRTLRRHSLCKKFLPIDKMTHKYANILLSQLQNYYSKLIYIIVPCQKLVRYCRA